MLFNRPTLAFDFDGVVTSPHKLKSEELKKRGYRVPPEDTAHEWCVKVCRVPEKIYEEVAYNVNITRLLEVPLEFGVKEALQYFVSNNVKLAIITSRKSNEIDALRRFLNLHKLKVDMISHTSREPKSKILCKLSPTMYVDDTPLELKRFNPVKNNCSLFLFRNGTKFLIAKRFMAGWLQGRWKDVVFQLDRLFISEIF